MKKWKIKTKIENQGSKTKVDELIKILLENRGINTKEEVEEFLRPKLESVTPESVGIDLKQLKKTLRRLKLAFDRKDEVIIYGDYDVDGITATAILWESLYSLGFKVLPYIPHRVDEGYGLSIKGIDACKLKIKNLKLIITVDNGIVANEAVNYARNLGIDVIITDHHLPEGDKRPDAFAIVHTTNLCGAGVAYLLSKEIQTSLRKGTTKQSTKSKKIAADSSSPRNDEVDNHLELAAMGTIADLVPLTGANRTIVKFGLAKLHETKRPGLLALIEEAAIKNDAIGTYEVGFIIAPRLNAAGRIESAMDSLRLLCTKETGKATDLAANLGRINRERQIIMKQATDDAIERIKPQASNLKKILFIGDKNYNPGVIGLVAGKLVEKYYRPSIVLSIGDTYAKASVRSIAGVNIIELLRKHLDMFVNIGGHPMAAGFTVAVDKMGELQEKLETLAEELITDDLLQRTLAIDCELPLSAINDELYRTIQKLSPFGMKNPEPVFLSRGVRIEDIRLLGREKNHLKLKINNFDAIAFGMGSLAENITVSDKVDIAYSLDENKWNGNVTLQLKVKDILLSDAK